jgi:hypothetical protein
MFIHVHLNATRALLWLVGHAIHAARRELSAVGNNTKVTREDWMRIALATLMAQGVDAVRVMPLSEALGVSRSSGLAGTKESD